MKADKWVPFLIIDDIEYLDWLSNLKQGDLAYMVNAHTFRLTHNQPQEIRKVFKTKVCLGMNIEFDRKSGLEIRDARWCSWEGGMRIMPEPNYSLIDQILDDLESQNCEAGILEVELMLLLEIKRSTNAPLRTSQLRKNVIKRVLREHCCLPGYTGVCDPELVVSMKKFTQAQGWEQETMSSEVEF